MVFAILVLRRPLRELIPTLKKLKYKELELEFEKETYELLEEIELVISTDDVSIPAPEELRAEHIRSILKTNPLQCFR